MNHKGNVLQVTLVMLMVLMMNVLTVYNYQIVESKALKRAQLVNQQRVLEVSLIYYIKDQILHDFLFSEYYENENQIVEYSVDDMGNYYFIQGYVEISDYEYRFELDIDLENANILRFEYL